MAYSIFTGKQRSLVFPVMCNAFATIDYSENVPDTGGNSDTSDDVGYGIWAHEGDFTFQAVITPYDINGYGCSSSNGHTLVPSTGVLSTTISNRTTSSSKKIASASNGETNLQSEKYMTSTARLTHEMRVFHSTNFQFSLVNSTLHNENEPAQYKLKVGLKLGSASIETFESDVVISANEESRFKYSSADDLTGFNDEGRVQYNNVAIADSVSTNVITLDSSSSTEFLFGGSKLEIFVRSGQNFTSLGKITSINSSAKTVTLDSTPSVTISSGDILYVKATKNPIYINNIYHVACSWNQASKEVKIFFNGNLVKTGTHTQTDTFSFAKEDFYLGANGTGDDGQDTAVSNKQFMGELHELAITSVAQKDFYGLANLLPNYNDTLLYLRFEEVDL